MATRAVAAGLALLLGLAGASPSLANESVTLRPDPGTAFEIDGRSYEGDLRLAASSSGLALTETTTVDRYLAGIKEVPFGWPDEALAAQVVAARTYLANTLQNGRSALGREHGYDICASSACQVYAGTSFLDDRHGDRWLAAVRRTAGEILVYEGKPILAVYSSSAGSRTMAVQDVWGGPALPYLQPVDSPEAAVSPFASWQVDVPASAFVDILAADGHAVDGELLGLVHRVPPEGEGRATLDVITTGGTATVLGTEVRGAMNRRGPSRYPMLLPASRGDGRRLPQALPSYNYRVSYLSDRVLPERLEARLPDADRAEFGTVRFVGEGWGHNLGLSQYGALAMALDGAGYGDILSHYYGGIAPEDAGALLPEEVVVGLGWELTAVTFTASGEFSVRGDDGSVEPRPGGTWWAIRLRDRVVLFPAPDDRAVPFVYLPEPG